MAMGGGQRLRGLLDDPINRGILGVSAGLLSAGAPRTDRPTSLGEAISLGLLSGGEAYDAAVATQDARADREDLQKLRQSKMDYYTAQRSKRPAPNTKIGKIQRDFANGLISKAQAEKLIASELRQDAGTPLSAMGKEAYDRATFPDLFPDEQVAQPVNIPDLEVPNLRMAASGDIAGGLKGVANVITGQFGGSAFPAQQEAKAQLNVLNNQLLEPLVKAISDRGAVYTQQRAEKLLPQPSMSDAQAYAKLKALPALLNNQLARAQQTLNNKSESEKSKANARDVVAKIPSLIRTVNETVAQYEAAGSRPTEKRGDRRVKNTSQGKITFKRITDGGN
jgi:hypothetical protein